MIFHPHIARHTATIFLIVLFVVVALPLIADAQSVSSLAGASDRATPACTGIVSCIVMLPLWLFSFFAQATATVLIVIGTYFLTLAGMLFNWLVMHTVIGFSDFYASTIKEGVETAWTAFRDIANILIIGIFTFIAISIILGLKEYGDKKLIARVLIVAVLINFSLLFTKMIIDASNFTATQIYTAAALGNGAVGDTQPTASAGIAGQFIYLLRVQTFGDAWSSVRKVSSGEGGWWLAPLYGSLIFAIVIGAALILLYGCFLLLSRIILLIFLMVTAAAAFASYLVPKWSSSGYGWSAWWSSLIKSALFAPILMFFLWMTLRLATAIHAMPGVAGGSFGDMVSNPARGANIGVLVAYLLILGLLFVSFKLSSTFAHKIAGFSIAGNVAASPVTLGSRFLAAPLLRQTAGWMGYANQKARGKEARAFVERAGQARTLQDQALREKKFGRANKLGGIAESLEAKAQQKAAIAARWGSVASSKMNVMDTSLAKLAKKNIGVTGFATGESPKDTKSYSDRIKKQAEAAEKKTPAISDEMKTNVRNAADAEAVTKAKEERRMMREKKDLDKQSAETTRRTMETVVATQKAALERDKNDADRDVLHAKAERDDKDFEHQRTLQVIQSDTTKSDSQKAVAVAMEEAKHASEMRSEAENIEKAESRAKQLGTRLDNIEKEKFADGTGTKRSLEEATTALDRATTELTNHDRENDEEIRKLATKYSPEIERTKMKGLEEARLKVGERLGQQEVNLVLRPMDGDRVAGETRDRLKKSSGDAGVLKRIADIVKADSGGGAAPSPAAPPAGTY